MKKPFVLLILFLILAFEIQANKPLKMNLFCIPHGGSNADIKILSQSLEALGCEVRHFKDAKSAKEEHADVNIFCQTLFPKRFDLAKFNWFIPNPEWYTHSLSALNGIDLILCRTHEVKRIFKRLQKETFFLGFTTENRYKKKIQKDYANILHLAGVSWQKGTGPIVDAWKEHPEFPLLRIIRHADPKGPLPKNIRWTSDWLTGKEIKYLQNQAGIHLCLSETEGFGHYIMEACSAGAVVLTTDAPPMNEFIKDSRCLVPYLAWRQQYLGTNYYVSSEAVEEKVQALLALPQEELEAIGKVNQQTYLKGKKQFKANLKKLVQKTAQRLEKLSQKQNNTSSK